MFYYSGHLTTLLFCSSAVVPHITNEIQNWIERVAQIPVDDTGEVADVCLIEVGGTVGDIESSIFFEALRQFQFRVGNENFCE